MNTYELGLPLVLAALLGVGLVTLSTAVPSTELFTQQLIFLGIGLAGCAVMLWLGRRRMVRLSYLAYALGIFLLVLTQLFGTEVNGARSWLRLGPLPSFQPSELAKIALIMALALALHERPIKNLLSYLRPAILIALPFVLIFTEPDLGGALVIAATGAGMLLVRGIPWRHLALFALVTAVALPTVVWPNLAPHQRQRLEIFINPASDPRGAGFQVIQSRIAIGSGGLWGKGYGQGTQSQLGFIPERHNDFIFPVLAEEGGFVGAVVLLILYGLLFWRLVAMAAECPLERDQLLIVGVLSKIAFQSLLNIGVTLGLAPVTGVNLPLVSAGGTSLISTLLALSLAYVVHRDRYQEW
ncbi:MAG: rod shape-determining protein RodA [Truepera sp.]|nr:rod shape-determining protein RodA [Truepera sp.]